MFLIGVGAGMDLLRLLAGDEKNNVASDGAKTLVVCSLQGLRFRFTPCL